MISNSNIKKALSQPTELTQLRLVNFIRRKKNRDYFDKTACNTSQVKYYNCQKMNNNTNNCPKPKN